MGIYLNDYMGRRLALTSNFETFNTKNGLEFRLCKENVIMQQHEVNYKR